MTVIVQGMRSTVSRTTKPLSRYGVVSLLLAMTLCSDEWALASNTTWSVVRKIDTRSVHVLNAGFGRQSTRIVVGGADSSGWSLTVFDATNGARLAERTEKPPHGGVPFVQAEFVRHDDLVAVLTQDDLCIWRFETKEFIPVGVGPDAETMEVDEGGSRINLQPPGHLRSDFPAMVNDQWIFYDVVTGACKTNKDPCAELYG